jgi:cation:H+ antiporter
VAILIALLLVVAGLVLLAVGGDVLIRGAVSLARLAGLTTAVIGLTVVALGTSLPELVVSLLATLQGQPDISVGNALGSNIFNIIVILGAASVVYPIPVHGNAVRVEWPVMVFVSALAVIVVRDGTIDRVEGGLFVLGLFTFIAFSVWFARREVKAAEANAIVGLVEPATAATGREGVMRSAGLVIVGVAALVIGGRLLVDGAVQLARLIGMTERVIGLTVVAAGTSAPELAASIAAARRKHADIAVANLLGSNIFNILGILGTTALVMPIPVNPAIVSTDVWWALGAAVGIFPLIRVGRDITRIDGTILLTAYGVYLVILLLS